MATLPPQKIKVHKGSKTLELVFEPESYQLPFEYLRVLSPSAEVRGHGANDGELPLNKQNVLITKIEPQGYYAIRITYDDGHDSGIYTWSYLEELGKNREQYWQEYLTQAEKKKEEIETSVVRWVSPPPTE